MTAKNVKVKEGEKLDANNIEYVISLLEAEKPITKKDACSILNISYNTTRLTSIIEKHREKKAYEKTRRAALRGKPASTSEIQFVIEGYLEGRAVSVIADSLYRTSDFVNQILDKYSVPKRKSHYSYFEPELIPEPAIREEFKAGEIVYSARYDSIAKIEEEFKNPDKKDQGRVYRIWLLSERWQQYAYQAAYDLASLEHLRPLGVKL